MHNFAPQAPTVAPVPLQIPSVPMKLVQVEVVPWYVEHAPLVVTQPDPVV